MTYITGGAVQLSGTTSLIDLPGVSAPSLSASGHGKIYFDSGTNTFRVSQNGSSYSLLQGITQITGDATAGPGSGSQTLTLATVNSNVGSFTYGNFTVNAKGLITAASSGTAPLTSLTGDVTTSGSGAAPATLATVNGNVGSFTAANITVDAKGRITAASNGGGGGITQLTGDVTAGPGSGSQAATIPSNTITTAMLQANSVSVRGNAATSFESGANSTMLLTCNITSTGSPILVNAHMTCVFLADGSGNMTARAYILRDGGSAPTGNAQSIQLHGQGASGQVQFPFAWNFVDSVGAGAHNYVVHIVMFNGTLSTTAPLYGSICATELKK